MADEESPRPFRRERNLSNRNFARGSQNSHRRRFSTESHSSIDSSSFDSSSAAGAQHDSTASTTSLQFSYSVNSETDSSEFQRTSLRRMLRSGSSAEPEERGAAGGDAEEAAPPIRDSLASDPALLGVKQKVQRFETMKASDCILFKTGKINWSTHPQHPPTPPPRHRRSLGAIRVLPAIPKVAAAQESAEDDADGAHSVRSSVLSVHQHSIDEEATDDEFDDSEFSDTDAEEESASNEFELAAGGEQMLHNMPLTPIPSPEAAEEAAEDAFGQTECDQSPTNYHRSTSLEQEAAQSTAKAGVKDFPRNFRSTPRPKTELLGAKNHNVKYLSLHHRQPEENEEAEGDIELRTKTDTCVHPILEELIRTEETYVENLLTGIRNYGDIFNRPDIPAGLRGKKFVLLGNIEQIAEFHNEEFLPMLKRNRRDLKTLFDEFTQFIEQNCFYGYVIFTMNKKRSLELCDIYKNYFKLLQTELDDKLGINSFLVQPIQRMARYPLLLNEFITTLFKHHESVNKQLFQSCCRLEKKVRTLLTVTNESEIINDIVDCNEFNVFYQGKFRKVSEFMVFDYTLKRTYRSKVFIFDKCIIYTEIKGKNLIFHGRYPCEHIGIVAKTKSFTLYYEQPKKQQCDFTGEPQLIEMWLDLIREMINSYVSEERKNLQERYSRENDHLHRKPPSLSLFRDSNRFSSDSGIGNIWVLPKPEAEETPATTPASNRTTWYAVT